MNTLWLGFLVDRHHYAEAQKQFGKTIELGPNNVSAYTQVGRLYEALGREPEAVEAYLRADSLQCTSAEELEALRKAASTGGLRGYHRQHLDLLHQKAKHSRVPPLSFASAYTRLGDKDKAMQMLEVAWLQRSPRLVWIRSSAVWDPLRSDPRFQALLHRMRFP
jgi:tetratricopeptide (TPR) repeat protein